MSTFVIKLSKTGKMPCQSFSLPAQACKTGGKLAKVKGSVCFDCYALKNFYRMPNVKAPREVNLAALPDPDDAAGWKAWVDAMIIAIIGDYFRWHDSGDLQSLAHLIAIVAIALAMPGTKFWLPTKEYRIIREYLKVHAFPDNLIVRVSSPMIDQAPLKGYMNTSTVHDKSIPIGNVCNAPSNGGKCGSCRACWDKSVPNISYAKH